MREQSIVTWRVVFAFVVAAVASACVPSEQPMTAAPQLATSQAPSSQMVARSVPPGQWRAVLVAGDSSSPAFNNGVETMRDRLTADGVRNVRVLAADPAGLSDAELASTANVRRALQAPGAAACFAFLTSHGDQRGFFLRASRTLLAPAALEQALDQGCGAAPTVLIVSACHSGTFITEGSRRPNRIILTAAATDRASFGCGVDNEYTYYDRCLLLQFDQAHTWRELAYATLSCVERTERRLGVRQDSRPQIFVGADVADLRLPGR
jgi:hypothetical protein